MRASLLHLPIILLTCQAASPPHPDRPARLSHPADQHVLSPDEPNSVSPLSNRQARGFVALGDSYSAGIGTGLDDQYLTSEGDCRRGQHGYPLLLYIDLQDNNNDDDDADDADDETQQQQQQQQQTNTSFQWLSCTGAGTADILSVAGAGDGGGGDGGQIDDVNTSLPLDFATLSAGGNDLGFFDVMNACIFRFYSLYSGTCDAALAASGEALLSGDFERRLAVVLHEILDRAAWERRPWFSITVTGYARFFNDETAECDDMSLGVWWGGPKLSRDIRTQMNALVVAANAKIRDTVALVNARFRGPRPRVVFVDYDADFEGHRFCEPGVVEPAYDRARTWFFLVGGPDNNETTTPPPDGMDGGGSQDDKMMMTAATLSPASALVDPETCLARARARADWGELALCYMARAKSDDPSLRPAYEGVVAENGMWWVPTSYGKTFHPRSLGCEAIRDRIYEVWREYGL